jgi:L-asparaginase II
MSTNLRASDPLPTAIVTRGGGVEAWHRAYVAVVDSRGQVTHALGDPELVTFTRSAIKPLQALPLVSTGACDALGLPDEALALAAGSHSGEDSHRALAERMLAATGASVGDLRCGAHWPIGMRTVGRFPQAGEDKDPLRHNCSGKHAGFLAVARVLGAARADYLDPDGPVQRAVLRAVADACEVDEAGLVTGIDGCSAPNFALPLSALARGFKNLATAAGGSALARVRGAMQAHPAMVSGEGRFDFQLQRAFGARVVAKGGAEGLQAIGFSEPALGVVVKVLDGADRALAPICMVVLAELGLVGDPPPAELAARVHPTIKNHRGTETGAVTVVDGLKLGVVSASTGGLPW